MNDLPGFNLPLFVTTLSRHTTMEDPYKVVQLQEITRTSAGEIVSLVTGGDHTVDNVEILFEGTLRVTTTTKGEPIDEFEDDVVIPLIRHATDFIFPDVVTHIAVQSKLNGVARAPAGTFWKRPPTSTAWHTQRLKKFPTTLLRKSVTVSDESAPPWAISELQLFIPIPVVVINRDSKTCTLFKPDFVPIPVNTGDA